MKRNNYGINLDEGIPLEEHKEFELLYVPEFENIYNKLNEWIRTGEKPLILGGQIGSGKTTLLNKIFSDKKEFKPDITLEFDQDSIKMNDGDFLAVLLSGFIKEAIKAKIDLSFNKLPEEIAGLKYDEWHELLKILEPKEISLKSFERKAQIIDNISKNTEYITELLDKIGVCLQENKNRNIFILASGIDKYRKSSSGYLMLHDIIKFLLRYKTIYEVNSTHLFCTQVELLYSVEKLYLVAFSESGILNILSRRMGKYADSIQKELKVIAKWSGGNPRQAIRILSYYQSLIKDQKKSKSECIFTAINRATSDFFAFSQKPTVELIKTIEKDGYIEASLMTLPGDKETAQNAMFGNWILLTGENNVSKWPVKVNPLIKATFEGVLNIEQPEFKILSEYANLSDMSGQGLDFNIIKQEESKSNKKNIGEQLFEEKTGEQLLMEYLATGVKSPIKLNLLEVFDIIGAALLSKNRSDRIIMAYKNEDILDIAKSYIIAKANSYEYQKCEHTIITGGETFKPIVQIKEVLTHEADIFSFEISGEWTDEQLDTIDKLRDIFLNYEIIFWIPLEKLKNKFLSKWTQLRQLFEIFILEDELFGNLTVDDINSDLEFFNALPNDKDDSKLEVVNNLEVVLKYLSEVKHDKRD